MCVQWAKIGQTELGFSKGINREWEWELNVYWKGIGLFIVLVLGNSGGLIIYKIDICNIY